MLLLLYPVQVGVLLVVVGSLWVWGLPAVLYPVQVGVLLVVVVSDQGPYAPQGSRKLRK